ncbi:MAG: type II secretion system protein [Opitutaceae bacterium]|jgi:prepilin-type N-terminal cleavage/methylation domain-containing protein/prepilin-type processing-associated H-X9-DG protein
MHPQATPIRHTFRAFTLVELLTVIAIVGILAALVMVSVGRVRQGAKTALCASNLRQLYVGTQLFAQDNRNLLPALYYEKPWYTVLRDGYLHDEKVFFCPSSSIEPAFNSTAISYGWNIYLDKGVNVAPHLQVRNITNAKELILMGDSQDEAGQQRLYIQYGNGTLLAGARHNESVNVVHADGSLACVPKQALRELKYWTPKP